MRSTARCTIWAASGTPTSAPTGEAACPTGAAVAAALGGLMPKKAGLERWILGGMDDLHAETLHPLSLQCVHDGLEHRKAGDLWRDFDRGAPCSDGLGVGCRARDGLEDPHGVAVALVDQVKALPVLRVTLGEHRR